MNPCSDFLFQQATPASFADSDQNVDWLWRGYLARGATTLLTSQWKAGKTTLLSLLLARMAAGGQLAGLPVTTARVAVVSEERLENWRRRHERLHFGQDLAFLCQPFLTGSTEETWLALIEHLQRLGRERGVELVVIDPLAQFLPGSVENNPLAMMDALRPIERLTADGMAVLLMHHPRKKHAAAGQSARGGGALCGSVDVLMEMKLPPATQPHSRRRTLLAWSRYQETPRERVIELSADGTDYFEIQSGAEGCGEGHLEVVLQLLAATGGKLTRRQLLDAWPAGRPAPHPVMLWRALAAAVRIGRLEQEGTGRRRDPFRYFLPGLDAPWMPDSRGVTDTR
jgi:hypothetical protein